MWECRHETNFRPTCLPTSVEIVYYMYLLVNSHLFQITTTFRLCDLPCRCTVMALVGYICGIYITHWIIVSSPLAKQSSSDVTDTSLGVNSTPLGVFSEMQVLFHYVVPFHLWVQLLIHFRYWWSLWCARRAEPNLYKMVQYWNCSATEIWYPGCHSSRQYWWSSFLPDFNGERVAKEKLWCKEVWWADMALVGKGSEQPCRWGKHGTCKRHGQKTQGWKYVDM